MSALQEIFDELKEVNKWFLFGIYLGLPPAELKTIEQNNEPGDVDSCKLDMLITWTNGICVIYLDQAERWAFKQQSIAWVVYGYVDR